MKKLRSEEVSGEDEGMGARKYFNRIIDGRLSTVRQGYQKE